MKSVSVLGNIYKYGLWIALLLLIIVGDLYPQAGSYQFTLKHRRCYDQIHVEVWAKALNDSVPKLGHASLVVRYNTQYLNPSITQSTIQTDSVNYLINQANPIDAITSPYSSTNGYSPIVYKFYGQGYFSLEIVLANLGEGGFAPSATGNGTFVGKMVFDIIGNPGESSTSDITWSKSTSLEPGDIRIFDVDGNDVKSKTTFKDPASFNILGVTLLSPSKYGQVIDRDQNYRSLSNSYSGGGYPVYFERSINPAAYTSPVDEDLGYSLEYSTDNGSNWQSLGRVSETNRTSSSAGKDTKYLTGEIFNPASGSAYTITTENGAKLDNTNYRKPVRVIWAKNPNFIQRSEQARIRITKLNGSVLTELDSRTKDVYTDMSDSTLVLGRLFFTQLNGANQYLKTRDNISNSTQLTVEGWINLNGAQAAGSEPAIIASSAGPGATELYGSKEGAWMMYLKDGTIPAFRARELEGRGNSGYLAQLQAYQLDALTPVSAAEPLSAAHSLNWVHLAATVKDNTAKLYVNGELVDQYTNTDAADIRLLTTDHPIWIGVNPNTTIDNVDFLNAGIKSFRVWRIALSQDEIRQRASGVVEPDNVSTYGDLRRGLDLYYTFEGDAIDYADDGTYQFGANGVDYSKAGVISNDAIKFRPDQPHINLTSPAAGVGALNRQGETFPVRWISYGIGDITKTGTKDVEIEYTIDGGESWVLAKNASGKELGGTNAVDVEATSAVWSPYLNNSTAANLRTINPYSHKTVMRIRGTEANTQSNLSDESGDFFVAPYFALRKEAGTKIVLNGTDGTNITGNTFYVEAWIRPYRFPTTEEGFFPIVNKMDSTANTYHYSLSMNDNGTLTFLLTDNKGNVRIANSDTLRKITIPNTMALDTPWTHVGVFVDLQNGNSKSIVLFYIDGNVQDGDSIKYQLGDSLKVSGSNDYATYIGYKPAIGGGTAALIPAVKNGSPRVQASPLEVTDSRGFEGELRDVRIWSSTPNDYASSGTQASPSALTNFVRGALTSNSDDLLTAYTGNLSRAFTFNGGSFIRNGEARSAGVSATSDNIFPKFYGPSIQYMPVKPYLKLVEPKYKQAVRNSDTSVTVRWVGFFYNGASFYPGSTTPKKIEPSLEFSIRGGGGQMVQPYQFVGSTYWKGNSKNSLRFPNTAQYLFKGTGTNIQFAGLLNATIADPDVDNKEPMDDQGPLSAALVNARLRLSSDYTINGETDSLLSEGPIFSITPATNFTVRVLLEGYQQGTSKALTKIQTQYSQGGLKIKLYKDNSGSLGALVDSAESIFGYNDRSPSNRNGGNKRFANVNFVFTNIADGNYWIVVDHINHLPIMSRFPAKFLFTGDDELTWNIESGWDFETWNGVQGNVLPDGKTDPWAKRYYSAYGYSYTDTTKFEYSRTGLINNDGVSGLVSTSSMPAMVAGDLDKDGDINAADRNKVDVDAGGSVVNSDVTGDTYVNATDRTIVRRNVGKTSSIYELFGTSGIVKKAGKRIAKQKATPAAMAGKLKADMPQASYSFRAYMVLKRNTSDKYIDAELYIQNTGTSNFALANCTFPITYNTGLLTFSGLYGQDSAVFTDSSAVGYGSMWSAPTESTPDPLSGVRTIEVNFDNFNFKDSGGVNVSRTGSYIGTLRFALGDKHGPIYFRWHPSKAVHIVTGEIITDNGDWDDSDTILSYSAAIKYPNGGEKLGAGRQYNILWQSPVKNVPVNLKLTTDAALSWSKINSDTLLIEKAAYAWKTPSVNSTKCLVRLEDAETGIEIDRSDAFFSITPPSAKITRPFNGLFYGGTKDSIQWNAAGYDDIYFDCSYDGGTTWTQVTSTVSSSLTSLNWTIPKRSTRKGLLRMVDAGTKSVLALSDTFRILYGNLEFTSPRAGDTLWDCYRYWIKWLPSEDFTFDIQVNTNGGSGSWTTLSSSVSSRSTGVLWMPTGYVSGNVVLRAIWDGQEDMVFGQSGIFTVKDCDEGAVEELPEGYSAEIHYTKGNESKVRLELEIPEAHNVSAEIYSLMGIPLKSIAGEYYSQGKHTLEIDLGDKQIVSGTYFVEIRIDNIVTVKKLIIIK